MVLMRVCLLNLHNQRDPKEPQAENRMSSSVRLAGPWRLAEAGRASLGQLPSLQAYSKDMMSSIGRQVLTSEIQKNVHLGIRGRWQSCSLCPAWENWYK